MYLTTIFFCMIGICKHVNATFVRDIGFDPIKIKIHFNCNGEMFCKLKQLAFLLSSYIQPCGLHCIGYFNK
jgi:hypothetical protein